MSDQINYLLNVFAWSMFGAGTGVMLRAGIYRWIKRGDTKS